MVPVTASPVTPSPVMPSPVMPSSGARPRRRAARTNDPVGMRQRVLDVAAALFQEHGYHATSMHDVMKAAGVTGGALHHHFPSKKSLGLAIIRERAASAVAETCMAPVAAARNAADGIAAVFRNVAATLDGQGTVRGCPLNNLALELSLADPDFRRAIAAVFDEWRAVIADKLRSGEGRVPMKAAEAEQLATFVVAAYSGAMALAKAAQSSTPLKLCGRQLAQVIAARPGAG
jgi:AcrR family transcriptional regulator